MSLPHCPPRLRGKCVGRAVSSKRSPMTAANLYLADLYLYCSKLILRTSLMLILRLILILSRLRTAANLYLAEAFGSRQHYGCMNLLRCPPHGMRSMLSCAANTDHGFAWYTQHFVLCC